MEQPSNLQDIADVAETVSIGGKDFKLAPLRPVDIAEAAVFVRSERRNEFLRGIRMEAAILPPAVIAETLSAIQCKAVTLTDVLDDWNGRLKLLHLSIRRAGDAMKYDALCKDIDPVNHNILLDVLLWVSGLIKPEQAGDPVPLEKKTCTAGP